MARALSYTVEFDDKWGVSFFAGGPSGASVSWSYITDGAGIAAYSPPVLIIASKRFAPLARVAEAGCVSSAEERARPLALFERIGQTHKQFCPEHEVALSTMTYWRRQRLPEDQRVGLVKIREEITTQIEYQPSMFLP